MSTGRLIDDLFAPGESLFPLPPPCYELPRQSTLCDCLEPLVTGGQPLAVVLTPCEWNALEPDLQRDLRYRLFPYEDDEFESRFRRYLPRQSQWITWKDESPKRALQMGYDEDY